MAAEVRSAIDVVTEALRRLNLIAGDAEAAGFEADNTLARWHELASDLADEEIIEFPAGEVPIEAFRSCVNLLADTIAPSYGRQPLADPDNDLHPSRVRLRRRLANREDGDVMTISEF